MLAAQRRHGYVVRSARFLARRGTRTAGEVTWLSCLHHKYGYSSAYGGYSLPITLLCQGSNAEGSNACPVSRIPCHFAQPFWAYKLPHRREIVPGAVF